MNSNYSIKASQSAYAYNMRVQIVLRIAMALARAGATLSTDKLCAVLELPTGSHDIFVLLKEVMQICQSSSIGPLPLLFTNEAGSPSDRMAGIYNEVFAYDPLPVDHNPRAKRLAEIKQNLFASYGK